MGCSILFIDHYISNFLDGLCRGGHYTTVNFYLGQ